MKAIQGVLGDPSISFIILEYEWFIYYAYAGKRAYLRSRLRNVASSSTVHCARSFWLARMKNESSVRVPASHLGVTHIDENKLKKKFNDRMKLFTDSLLISSKPQYFQGLMYENCAELLQNIHKNQILNAVRPRKSRKWKRLSENKLNDILRDPPNDKLYVELMNPSTGKLKEFIKLSFDAFPTTSKETWFQYFGSGSPNDWKAKSTGNVFRWVF